MKNQFKLLKVPKFRKQLVTSIALHKTEKTIKPFLLKIVKSQYNEKVRANAIFWLGEYEFNRYNFSRALEFFEKLKDQHHDSDLLDNKGVQTTNLDEFLQPK